MSVNRFVEIGSQCLTRSDKITTVSSILQRGCLRLWLIISMFALFQVSCGIRSSYLEDSRLKPARHLPLETRHIGFVIRIPVSNQLFRRYLMKRLLSVIFSSFLVSRVVRALSGLFTNWRITFPRCQQTRPLRVSFSYDSYNTRTISCVLVRYENEETHVEGDRKKKEFTVTCTRRFL